MRGALYLPALTPCVYTQPSHFPTVGTAGVALRAVCVFLCSTLECILSTFVVLSIY